MVELFFTTIVIFAFFFGIFFFIIDSISIMKKPMIFFQFILCFILFSKNFYKKHILWKETEYKLIHKLSFNPISELFQSYEDSSFQLDFRATTNNTFSINKTDDYPFLTNTKVIKDSNYLRKNIFIIQMENKMEDYIKNLINYPKN